MASRPSPAMLDTLQRLARNPLRRLHDTTLPGKPPWPAHPNTLMALLRHELADHEVRLSRDGYWLEEWTITDKGRLVLNPPPRSLEDVPMFLDRRGGYTERAERAVDFEVRMVTGRDGVARLRRVPVESVDAPERLVEAGRVRHREAQDRRALARQHARNGRRAA